MSESEPAGACSRMASGEYGPQAEPEANRSESEPAGACSRMASGECGPQAEPEANRSESGLQAKPDVRRLCL